MQKYVNDENHSEFQEKKIKKKDIQDYINRRVHPHNHFVDQKSKFKSKEYPLSIANDYDLPLYLQFNKIKYSKWFEN